MKDFDAKRMQLVEAVRRDGITDPDVLQAIGRIPREKFVPEENRIYAYGNFPLPIGEEQTISQPSIVGMMTELLELKGDEKVLEIGTGSGYQTAVLAELCKEVYTIERHHSLAKHAQKVLQELGYTNIHQRVGDGSMGWPEEAPFDCILVTAAAPKTPKALLRQLKEEGGRMVIPVGHSLLQVLLRITRHGDEFREENIEPVRFVPLVGKQGWDGQGENITHPTD